MPKIPEGIPIRIENRFLQSWKMEKHPIEKIKKILPEKVHCAEKKLQAHKTLFQAKNVYESEELAKSKNQNLRGNVFSSPSVYRIVPKKRKRVLDARKIVSAKN